MYVAQQRIYLTKKEYIWLTNSDHRKARVQFVNLFNIILQQKSCLERNESAQISISSWRK